MSFIIYYVIQSEVCFKNYTGQVTAHKCLRLRKILLLIIRKLNISYFPIMKFMYEKLNEEIKNFGTQKMRHEIFGSNVSGPNFKRESSSALVGGNGAIP